VAEAAIKLAQTSAHDNQTKGQGREAPHVRNPYLDARREWNERYGDYISRERSWKLAAMLSSLVALVAVMGVIYIGSQSKFIPFAIGVDELGRAQAYGPVSATNTTDPKIIKASIIQFVEAWRTVSADAWLERKNIFDAYAFVSRTDPAYTTLSEYWQQAENEPFKRAAKETVTVEIKAVFPVTEDSYQVEWVEILRDRQGKQKGEPLRFKGSFHWTQGQLAQVDEKVLWINPFQIYLPNFAWSKVY